MVQIYALSAAILVSVVAAQEKSPQEAQMYCEYECKDGSHHTGCLPYCASKDSSGCSLVPSLPPIFGDPDACQAFLQKRPRCHKGGSCYVRSGLPAFPDLSHGFSFTGESNLTQWQYGIPDSQVITQSVGAIPAGKLARLATRVSMRGAGDALLETIVRGDEHRVYSNQFIQGRWVGCMYSTLNDSLLNITLEALVYKNNTWLQDVEQQAAEGVQKVNMFACPVTFLRVAISIDNSTVPPEPMPQGGGCSMEVRADDQHLLRSTSSVAWAEPDWDANGGLQAMHSVNEYISFSLHTPPAEWFQVPEDWGTCHAIPPPPAVELELALALHDPRRLRSVLSRARRALQRSLPLTERLSQTQPSFVQV
mmetsp:Transcript_27352/g.63795  ORF Transcript_27352/g.63795 Transcript_27352/m.63795 type:complete len:365 (+) Transcript_27352:82-1176(+)